MIVLASFSIWGAMLTLCAVAFCIILPISAIGSYLECRKKGFTSERVEFCTGCLLLFFLVSLYFPICEIWHDKEVKAEQEHITIYGEREEGLPLSQSRPIKATLVAITIGIISGLLEKIKPGDAKGRAQVNLGLLFFVGICTILVWIAWLSGSHLTD